jgi:hypothetical protein
MKRNKPAQRRARASGVSPYARYHKAPYQYSAAYHAWKRKPGARDDVALLEKNWHNQLDASLRPK